MATQVVTKKSFIGGRLVYPGEMVDVDAKGELAPAASTPIGALTIDQLRSALSARETEDEKAPVYGKNVADPAENNTGTQALAMAPVAPYAAGATNPQGIPPGTVPHNGGFIHPAPTDAPAAVEVVVSASPEQAVAVDDADTTVGAEFDAELTIKGNLDEVTPRIANLSGDDLDAVERAENDREVPRKGVLAAIEAARVPKE